MSISSTTNRNDYTGTNSLDTYSYTFKVTDKSYLKVIKRDTDSVETILTVDVDYTVTGVNNTAGGTIVLTAGDLPTDYHLTIRRVELLKQETDIRNSGEFYPETHEDAFDHFVAIDQQQQDEIDRSVKLPETVAASEFNGELPASIAGSISKVLGTNPTGNGFVLGPTFTEISNARAYAIAAAASAAAALVSEGNASTSETNALASETAADVSEAAAYASELAAALSASNAGISETNAETHKNNASGFATTATTQAGIATTQAGIATTQAGTATTQAGLAAASALAASNSESAAAGSASAAAGSALQAEGYAQTALQIFKYVIGIADGCTHSTLAGALALASAGDAILIKDNATIDTGGAFTLSLANLLIQFAPGVTYTKGTLAGSLFTIDASGCRIKGGRFSGFDTAITINSTRQYNFITECRFASCTNEVTESDSAPVNVIAMNVTE